MRRSTPPELDRSDERERADPRTGGHPLLTGWQKVLIAVLAVLALAGGALAAVRSFAAPAPEAAPTAAAAVPFGSRPESEPIVCRDERSVRISGRTFRGIDAARPAITVQGCTDVVIEDNDFVDTAEPIYVQGSRNVTIRGNRYRNITGPHERDGSHRGNFTQWDQSFGGAIVDNVGIGGDTEDVVSIYRSGGLDAEHPLLIQGNRFEGTNWSSVSGSGILLGDGGGSHVLVRDNVLVNVGQVGIGVAGGSDIRVIGNTVYGQRRQGSNVGIYTWGQGSPCSDLEVRGNRVDFTKADGTPSAAWDGGNCGTVAGWSDNRFGAALDASALRVRL